MACPLIEVDPPPCGAACSPIKVIDPPDWWPRDPVAQSFKFDKNCFITSIDLFFATVDKANPNFWVSIRETNTGIPGSQDIAVKNFNTADVKTSDDGTVAFNAAFDYPVWVEGNKEYCFVVGGYTPKTRLWFSRLGEQLINNESVTVETQPVLGSSFRSQNGSTWTPEQFEDIKYRIYVAKFKYNSLNVTLDVNDVEREILPEDPFECELRKDLIRLHWPDHGLVSGDKFTINMCEDAIYSLKLDGIILPKVGTKLYAESGWGIITSVEKDAAGKVKVMFKDLTGQLLTGEHFTNQSEPLFNVAGVQINETTPVTGIIEDAAITSIAGVSVSALAGTHYVELADTPDSVVFRITSSKLPTSSGRFGGRNIYVKGNTKYEVFNFSGAYLPYSSSEKWMYSGLGHNPDGGIFKAYDYVEENAINFMPSTDVHAERPMKMACAENLSKTMRGSSVRVTASFSNSSPYESAVINTNTFSNTIISNRVSWMDAAQMNVIPNAADRYVAETQFAGSELYKYVTKQVSLKKAASDMVIMFDCYKHKDADFDVYYKMVMANTNDSLENVQWIKVPIAVKKDSANWNDKIEYSVTLSEAFGVAWTNNEFTSFKVKLVGRSKNTACPPLFQNLRVIAVT